MRKLFLLAVATVMSVSVANAQTLVESQNSEPVPSRQSKVYCELRGTFECKLIYNCLIK